MVTRRLTIKKCNRVHPIRVVGPTDFTTEAAGEIKPEEVLRDPKFSLYCFDPENASAIFVEASDPSAVDRAPFYYQAQVQYAVGLVSMPFDAFHKVTAAIPEPPKGLIFIHSVGRCGSTLISKVLEGIPAIHSLSEPDDLTQMVGLRAEGFPDEALRRLLESSVRWRCKPRLGSAVGHVAIKSRSEVMVLADLLGPAFPHSKHFFLYRDGVSWMRSVFRGWSPERDVYDEDLNRKMETSWSNTIPLVRELSRNEAPMNAIQIRVLAWITCMEGYLRLKATDIPLSCARYEDLTANPIPILEQFFAFCGIDDVNWTVIHEVLGRDSQAGTIYDREERRKQGRELTPELEQDVRGMIALRPLLSTSDVVLPGTLSFPLQT